MPDPDGPPRLVHLMGGLEVGGKERVVLELTRKARQRGLDHRIVVFDTPFRNETADFDPGEIPVDFLRRRPGLDWSLSWRLKKRLEAERVPVLHAHNDTAMFYGALATAWGKHRPVLVGTFHAHPTHSTGRARVLTRWASQRAGAVTAVSDELGERLRCTGWTVPCRIVWNGIDLEAFKPRDNHASRPSLPGINCAGVVVAHIGRFVPVKRQQDLITAARRLGVHHPELDFVLVGEGPTRADIEESSRDLPQVHFLPRVKDVARFLHGVDLLVLCSEHEAAPRVLLEAMACAVPVVATDVGGVRAMVTDPDHGVGALLVPAQDPSALARAIASLVEDPIRRWELGQRARKCVCRFSADGEWQQYQRIYQDCLRHRGP